MGRSLFGKSGMRVLIAEDDNISSMVLRAALEKMGHEVTAVKNGVEAWCLFEKTSFPLVISDWMMPTMDGVELCRRIRSLGTYPYTYVILLTARATREDRMAGLRAGADDFLTKPLDISELDVRLKIAARILSVQEELQKQSARLEAAHKELEHQHESLAEAMIFMEVANHRFSELFQGLPVACFTYDSEGQIHEWNRACEALYGLRAHQVFERTIWETICRPEDVERAQEIVARVFAGERFEGLEWVNLGREGMLLYVLCNTFPLCGPDGSITGAISANVDITDRKRAEQQIEEQMLRINQYSAELEYQKGKLEEANAKLETLAITDGLTGLKNHRHFREVLEQNFAHARRYDHPLSIILLDVDRFKQYNDTYGHPAGDAVLRVVADVLRQNVREVDLVARYGGEEFVILLPNTDYESSTMLAERLRASIEQQPWLLRPVTASFGVSTLSQAAAKASVLVDEADRALYYSKEQGRNRVTHYDDLPTPILEQLARTS